MSTKEAVAKYGHFTTTQPERCRNVADWIEANEDKFDMREWLACGDEIISGHDLSELRRRDALDGCDTTACIAGWAVHLYPRLRQTATEVPYAAASILGLSSGNAARWDDLFYDDHLTAADAVAILRDLADRAEASS